MGELIIYHIVNIFGIVIRMLPVPIAYGIGRWMGYVVYYLDGKHRQLAYLNLKQAFGANKSPIEIRQITMQVFVHFGQNIIDTLRMPLVTPEKFPSIVEVSGKEYVFESLKKGKGVIFLAMHFGSWEMASLTCTMLGFPYKMMAKSQVKNQKLSELLSFTRSSGGYRVLMRGMGTRDFVKSLKNNEVVGLVADQGGRDGVLIPFFGRNASMSVGAIRMGLKWDVPICFSVIYRKKNEKLFMGIHEPFLLEKTGDLEKDVVSNLKYLTKLMEQYIWGHPAEYLWFYKIWKYSNQTTILILSDGKTGHLRQSQLVAQQLQKALAERNMEATVQTANVRYKNKFAYRCFSFLNLILPTVIYWGRFFWLKLFLTNESFKKVLATRADYIVSCGAATSGVSEVIAKDNLAKGICILKPGILGFDRFDLVVLPQHDIPAGETRLPANVVVTHGAPNMIDDKYLQAQTQALLVKFSHLQKSQRDKIGVFIGGDTKHIYISEQQIRILANQLKDVAQQLKVDLLVTTSRRTPVAIEQLLHKELKKHPSCSLLILANQENIPEAVGGILGLSDIIIVSGDSVSMISEAATSGKKTIVFLPESKGFFGESSKHLKFIASLNRQGYVVATDAKNIGHTVMDAMKNKFQTKKLEDDKILLKAMGKVI